MGTADRFSRRLVSVAVLLCALALVNSPAWAQEATVFGQVTDESGAVLPGATVTVSSPALQVKQVVQVTNASGEYRVTPLPLGTYSIEFTLTGFQTMRREGLQLTAGFVARVDVALKVGAVEESVTVSGISPVVDVKTTSLGTQVTRDLLEAVPTARNSLISLLTLASGSRGLADAGQIQGLNASLKAFGRFGQSWQTVEGVSTTSTNSGNPASSDRWDIESFEEADIKTIGGSAEAPTAGIQVNVIIKSGGNDFHGGGIASQVPRSWQGSNISDALRARGINDAAAFRTKWDRAANVGGRIVRDRVWFFGAGRMRREITPVTGSYGFDGAPALANTPQHFLVGKGTAQLTPAQRLIGSYQWQELPRIQRHPATSDEYADFSSSINNSVGKGEWQLVKGNKLLSLVAGVFDGPFPRRNGTSNSLNPALAPDVSAWTDTVRGTLGGINPDGGRQKKEGRKEVKGTLNWYKPDLFLGNHDFKAGVSYFRALQDYLYWGNDGGNYVLRYRNGVPDEIAIVNSPVFPETSLRYLGTFVQDSWALNRRLTLNLGVRYANDQSVVPAQCRQAAFAPFATLFPAQCFEEYHLQSFSPVAPRLHAAYDVTGDGKTVIKGGYGRFYLMHYQEETDLFNANTVRQSVYKWHSAAPNGCTGGAASLSVACTARKWLPGESNLDPNGPDFVSNGQVLGNQLAAGLIANPDFKEPGNDEFSLSLERELMASFGVRVTGVYTKDFNSARILNTARPYSAYNIPLSAADPGPDGALRTADDPGTFINYFDYPASLAGIKNQVPMFINDPAADSSYKTIEVAGVKRLSKGWQLSASYTATKKHITGLFGGTVDPNSEINKADNNWEWMTRVAGSYMLPFEVQAAANVLYQSGDPWARTVSVRGSQIGSLTVNAEPVGTQRTPNPLLVTLMVDKAFRLGSSRKVNVGVNVINLLNADFILWSGAGVPQLVTASGPNLGIPRLNIVAPRVAEVRLRYTF